ncbi:MULTISPECIES: hypothetical protein [Mycolicibacterium]|uniref:Uncharacterized protein n=1 Tax=Mycolicibacterium neoaurum TaxID=1795 RepID=A0AAV2WQM8_MYCNE|nr:hypothetical protein [Mycolicibacterium neoaurum]QVI29853.1 hypothetical protein MN2019_11475 [Mycolicibacterium neoaurum]CDQ46655.1 hypothetical protein BN1047_04564 [Mycolicibacterium neoaurum]
MPSDSASRPAAAATEAAAATVSAVDVISCSRLGRTANPPTRSILDWWRSRRNRYDAVSGA